MICIVTHILINLVLCDPFLYYFTIGEAIEAGKRIMLIKTDQEARSYIESNVSRETFDRLRQYHSLLLKWNRSLNLISYASGHEIWLRHILDSYQLAAYIEMPFADLGSGAGFPGLVCALTSGQHATLVESDAKKCVFLRNVSRETSAPVAVYDARIESIDEKYHLIVSRALTSVANLLIMSQNMYAPQTQYLLLKGEKTLQEIEDAQQTWEFDVDLTPSITSGASYIVALKNIRKKQ